MSAPAPETVRRLKGRLVAAPTSLSTAYPHGGTELGFVSNGRFIPNVNRKEIRAEEFGQKRVEIAVAGDGDPVLLAVLRNYDLALLQRVFPSVSVGTSSNEAVIEFDANEDSILIGADRGFVLFFSPDNVDLDPAILFYNALPLVQEAAELQLTINAEFSIAVAFLGAPDASFRDARIGKREDLVL